MNNKTRDPYLKGLLKKDRAVIQLIYQIFAPRIEAMIVQHGGNQADARDVFQEALIIVWRKSKQPSFELTSSFYSFLYGICYYTWQRQKKKKDNNTVTISEASGLRNEVNLETELEKNERHKVFQHHFTQLGKDCRTLLKLFFAGTKMKKIAELMAIENEHAARNRKYRCQKKLEKGILNDSLYKELSSRK